MHRNFVQHFLNRTLVFLHLVFFLGFVGNTGEVRGDIVITSVNMVARQQVNLLGVPETLVSSGVVKWTFDVDGNRNTVPGGVSSVDALFTGVLPTGFGGLAGANFELFTLPGGTVTASNSGTHVRASTNFGLRVFAAPNVVLANFFTTSPSLFESDVTSLTNFTGSVFQDPARPNDITQVFIGANGLGVDVGSLVGISFDRTVTAVPEPSSLALCSIVALTLLGCCMQRKSLRVPKR